jgi:hypothetical protein
MYQSMTDVNETHISIISQHANSTSSAGGENDCNSQSKLVSNYYKQPCSW